MQTSWNDYSKFKKKLCAYVCEKCEYRLIDMITGDTISKFESF